MTSTVRSLRIVTTSPFFAWRFGGSVEVIRLVSAELARRGHDVRILTTNLGERPDRPTGWSESDGVRVFRAPAGRVNSVPPYLPPDELARAVDQEIAGADIVTSHVALTVLGSLTAKRCAKKRVPFVYAAQGALDPARLRQKRWRKAAFVATCERPLLRSASALHALTAGEADDLTRQGAPGNRVFVVPNGIESAHWQGGDRTSIRRDHGIPTDARVVLFLGRLAPEKGVENALRAAAPLLLEDRSLLFVAAGPDDGVEHRLRAVARRMGVTAQVMLPGPIEPDRRADWLAAADVFAYPSVGEGLPLAVLEAAAAGLPLWITRGCNLPEVEEFDAGTVATPDVPALSSSLRGLLADEDAVRTRGLNAARMVRERFTLSAVVDRLERRYAELAG